MADNEERIHIQVFIESPCKLCSAKSNIKNCSCTHLWRYRNAPTRQEAIEKMAKAHFNCAFRKTGTKWEDLTSIVKGKYYKYAENALNALLGVENDTK